MSAEIAQPALAPSPKSANLIVGTRDWPDAGGGGGGGAFGSGAGAVRSASSSESLFPMIERLPPQRRRDPAREAFDEAPPGIARSLGGGGGAAADDAPPRGLGTRGAVPPADERASPGTGSRAGAAPGRALCGGGAAADAAPPRLAPAAVTSPPGGDGIVLSCRRDGRAAGLLPGLTMQSFAAGLLPQPCSSFGLSAETATDCGRMSEMSTTGMAKCARM